jgi:hypothetical protein
MDRLTWQGITTGSVTLPGRPVHVGVWLRIMRTLLDEVSIRQGRLTRKSAASIAMIWEATGRPPRGGLTVWRPYERLGPALQRAMTEAAATALQLAASGEITPCCASLRMPMKAALGLPMSRAFESPAAGWAAGLRRRGAGGGGRGAGYVSVTSVTAERAACSSTMALPAA